MPFLANSLAKGKKEGELTPNATQIFIPIYPEWSIVAEFTKPNPSRTNLRVKETQDKVYRGPNWNESTTNVGRYQDTRVFNDFSISFFLFTLSLHPLLIGFETCS